MHGNNFNVLELRYLEALFFFSSLTIGNIRCGCLLGVLFVMNIHLQLLFDFLAFKNDVSFWRRKRNFVGLSSRTVVWRAFSQAVVFLYLMDEETSLLVLVPTGIATVIEVSKKHKGLILHGNVQMVSDCLDVSNFIVCGLIQFLPKLFPFCKNHSY